MNLETPKDAIEELNRITRENEIGLAVIVSFIFVMCGLVIWSCL